MNTILPEGVFASRCRVMMIDRNMTSSVIGPFYCLAIILGIREAETYGNIVPPAHPATKSLRYSSPTNPFPPFSLGDPAFKQRSYE